MHFTITVPFANREMGVLGRLSGELRAREFRNGYIFRGMDDEMARLVEREVAYLDALEAFATPRAIAGDEDCVELIERIRHRLQILESMNVRGQGRLTIGRSISR